MKKNLIALLLTFSSVYLHAKCADSLGGFGNNPENASYNIASNVAVVLNANNTISLNLANNYSARSEPDVRALLVDSNGISDSVLATTFTADLNHFEFDLTKASRPQTLTVEIPEGKHIAKFDDLFFCFLEFDPFWELETFDTSATSSCAVLEVTNFTLDRFSIHLNLAKTKIYFSNIAETSAEIHIFNVLGNQVFRQDTISKNSIEMFAFNAGNYIVKIANVGKSKKEKLVIQYYL
jgi:hypothetical protein